MKEVTIGEGAPGTVNAVIEIPKGSRVKYEMDDERGYIVVDRVLHAEMVYPGNYGYIPETMSDDGDPLDVLVIATESFYPYTVARARPIGVLNTKDEKGHDPKLVAVAVDDPEYESVKSHEDLSKNNRKMIRHFFERYKDLEAEKFVEILGWEGSKKARVMVEEALESGS